jgi:hypothetical protein
MKFSMVFLNGSANVLLMMKNWIGFHSEQGCLSVRNSSTTWLRTSDVLADQLDRFEKGASIQGYLNGERKRKSWGINWEPHEYCPFRKGRS